VELGNQYLADIESAIGGQGLDVLFYPDLGMSPLTYFLAYSRLAPLQCVSWGHPVTTGLDSMDFFISSDAIEPPGAAGHYSERLVRLPSFVLPAYERPPPVVDPKPRWHFGFGEDRHLYFCPQALFKIHPDFDQAIAQILRRDPIGDVVLIESEYPSFASVLGKRFRRHFPDVVDRVKFIPRMTWPECLNLMAVSDVILDTFHFGGGNTSCEALAMGTPVVTLPSAFLRGRFTAACYWEMGLGEYVARDPQDYVDLAVRLAQERDYREHAVRNIVATRDVLFENMNGVREIEKFLLESARDT
jgi:protein O-GlcNAc transferase